jgi:SNF2 family DNA or RNA helicase
MWHDPETNMLIYESVDARLLEHCHDSVRVNGAYTAFPATIPNLQVATLLGFEVIRPLKSYDWPRAGVVKEPFHAQTETSNFLCVNPRASVLSDMGTGKTLAALWAADALMREEKFSALIVAPLTTLQSVWADAAFHHFLGRRKLVILHGTSEQRIKALSEPADFYCINPDGIKVGARLTDKRKLEYTGFAAALAARKDIRLAIVDEVGNFRDHRSLRSKVCRDIVASRDYYWGMTGTPTPNGPTDAYGIAKLLNNAHGEMFTSFKNRTMMQLTKWKWVPRPGAHEAAMNLLRPYIRFSIDDCTDLPELSYQTHDVDLTTEQEKLLREIKREFMLEMEKGTISAVNEAALRTKMLQICQGAVYDENHKEHFVDCGPRLRALEELIENGSAKTLVFCGYTSVAKRLNMGLKKFSRELIIGETGNKERTRIIRAFQQERDPRVLIAHPETISHGQTLTAAATTVWFGPIDKTDQYIQANKRMHRPGQVRPCVVVNLAGGRLEREIYQRLANNQSLQGVMLRLAEQGF